MATYGPDERALFEDDAAKLYDEICHTGGIAASDYRIAEDGEHHAAFQLLVRHGPARLRRRAGPLVAGGPRQRPVPCGVAAEPARLRSSWRSQRSGTRPSAASPRAGAGRRRHRQATPSPTCVVRRSTASWSRSSTECRGGAARRRSPRPAATRASWPRLRYATSRRWSGASRCARSTNTAPGAARRRASTSRPSPPAAPRCDAGRVLQPDDRRGPPDRPDPAEDVPGSPSRYVSRRSSTTWSTSSSAPGSELVPSPAAIPRCSRTSRPSSVR